MILFFGLLDINWQAVGLQAGQLILSLSILVVMHELGHFMGLDESDLEDRGLS